MTHVIQQMRETSLAFRHALLKSEKKRIVGVIVTGWSRTADDTGGDFYEWKKLPDGRWVVVLADVTGHGIGPAILASACRAYSRASFNVRDRLETMLKNINQAFAEDLAPERFATLVAAVCEEGSDQVELLSAGHGPIFVYSSDNQSFQLMNSQALPLGILPDLWDAVPVKFSMKPGDIVLLITEKASLEYRRNLDTASVNAN
jgi:serine phosphatase RsbU (regulator of sigma subunit)